MISTYCGENEGAMGKDACFWFTYPDHQVDIRGIGNHTMNYAPILTVGGVSKIP